MLTVERTQEGGLTRIVVSGVINEDSNMEEVFGAVGPRTIIDLAGIERINSCGIREWVNALKEVDSGFSIEYHRCSIPLVEQFNMISNFAGQGVVKSLYAPYLCEECDENLDHLIEADSFPEDAGEFEPPEVSCPKCGSSMQFDDDEDEYFMILEVQKGRDG